MTENRRKYYQVQRHTKHFVKGELVNVTEYNMLSRDKQIELKHNSLDISLYENETKLAFGVRKVI